MDKTHELAEAEKRIRELALEIAAARDSADDFEAQIIAARAASEAQQREISAAREAGEAQRREISVAREAAKELERQIESARRGSSDLEAQLERCRQLDLDHRQELNDWIRRHVDLDRTVRRALESFRNAPSTSHEAISRIFEKLRDRPSAAMIENWPLVGDIPSGELIHRTSGHRDREHFAQSRAPGLRTVLALAAEGGCEIEKLEHVLDFGCGCGRLLAAWEPYCPSVEVCGVDLDGDLIDWCNEYLPFVDARQNRLEPPLDFPAGRFDLIYAASVFTHLTAEAGQAWAEELHRLLRPGGTLVASYHGPHYHEILKNASKADYDRLSGTGFHVTQNKRGLTGPQTEGSNAFAAFHTAESFRALFTDWEPRVTSLAADRGATHFASYQDVVVFRRL